MAATPRNLKSGLRSPVLAANTERVLGRVSRSSLRPGRPRSGRRRPNFALARRLIETGILSD